MTALIVSGVSILVAPGPVDRVRDDLVDRGRALDGTYKASATGSAKRNWNLRTPPVPRGTADGYEITLSSIVALPCSGDIIGGGKNDLLWSRDKTNGAWVKTNTTATHNQIGIDGVANSATHLAATAANATTTQALVLASGSRQMSAWVARGTGSGVIQMTTDAAAADWITITPTLEYQRFSIPAKVLANPNSGFRIVTSGDTIIVDYAQNESGTKASAPTATTTAAVGLSTVNCFPEITDWQPVVLQGGHYVVLSFTLHES